MSESTGFEEPSTLATLNEEAQSCVALAANLAELGSVGEDLFDRILRRIQILQEYANRQETSPSGVQWWVIEGSTFASSMAPLLAGFRRINFQSESAITAWIRDFDRSLLDGVRGDVDGGPGAGGDDERAFVRSLVRRASRELEAQFALMRAVEGAISGAARVETEVEAASEAASEAAQYAENSRAASGLTGSSVLAQGFRGLARDEHSSANRWRIATLAILVLVAAYAVYHLASPSGLALEEVLARIAVSVPFFALAAYCAREAGQHRIIERWAASLAVQLQTIDAFCDPLAEQSRSELRLMFGKRVFGASPPKGSKAQRRKTDVGGAVESGGVDIRELTDLVRIISDTAGTASGALRAK